MDLKVFRLSQKFCIVWLNVWISLGSRKFSVYKSMVFTLKTGHQKFWLLFIIIRPPPEVELGTSCNQGQSDKPEISET